MGDNTDFLIKLGDPPRMSNIHVWADYIELLALTNEDRLYSAGALEDVLGEIEDLAIDQEELDDGPLDDAISRRWADIKNCLISRKHRFGDSWPFEIDDTVLKCRLDKTPDNYKFKLYIALLIASCLRYVEKKTYPEITSNLELIGYHIFRKMMPEPWIIKPFGANQQIGDGYKGILFEKFKSLSKDLNADLILKEGELRPGDSGDGGIDLVAWHPMGDTLGNIPIAFAQCGASLTDLFHKQFEAHPANLNNKILPQHPGMNYYFAPHDIRRANGIWDKKPAQVIMIDRARIIGLAGRYNLSEKDIVDAPHIKYLINMRRANI